MEHIWNGEQGTLVNELIQGMELAEQLRLHLDTASSAESRDSLVQQIVSSYEKTLLILKSNGSMDQQQPQQNGVATSGVPELPLSIDGSARRDDLDKENQDSRDISKKRNMLPRWTDQVRITSESLLEGTHDDGYSWRNMSKKTSYFICNNMSAWTDQVRITSESLLEGTHDDGYSWRNMSKKTSYFMFFD
ncbi:probable WRKY transcription factor 41 [Hibiscus syriacus]|uniref:probable WRKY transcription factor 41 n=1 Tax=Hibiscus syriacus TaxID=106335 RepID=UPI001923EFDF|nr:probable WRKY transcription factor 41 [Hibiscus syriacus]